jgi:hypothetical protein
MRNLVAGLFREGRRGMAVLTADLRFVDVNDQFLAEAGRQVEELIGHTSRASEGGGRQGGGTQRRNRCRTSRA